MVTVNLWIENGGQTMWLKRIRLTLLMLAWRMVRA